MNFKRRLGQFCTILGGFLVALFVFSDVSQLPEYRFLGTGVILLVVGVVLIIGNPKPPPEPSTRFRLLRKMREKSNKGPKPQKVSQRSQAYQEDKEEREREGREKGQSQ